MDGGAWWAIVHRVAKSQRRLRGFTSLYGSRVVDRDLSPLVVVQSRDLYIVATCSLHDQPLE